jgi:hypothetical protein
MFKRLTLLTTIFVAAGCGKSSTTTAAGSDAGVDAGPIDAGDFDGGTLGIADAGGVLSGQVDASFPAPSTGPAVPALPKLLNVVAATDDDRVAVTFNPVAGAKDYRIYPLPAGNQISVDGTGFVTLTNATYRCAGDRFAVKAQLDDSSSDPNIGWTYTSVNQKVDGFQRGTAGAPATAIPADAHLGFIYVEPGDGRVPVYALGDPTPGGDNMCGTWSWGAARSKKYVTSDSARLALLQAGWRDDGIVFYAPAAGDVQIQTSETTVNSAVHRLYFASGTPEATARAGNSPVTAFTVLSTQAAGMQPLVRVQYVGRCFNGQGNHDELAPGDGWFERLSTQGNQPVFETQWAGITAQTTFVVEALDQGCPFQGHLSAQSRPKFAGEFADPFVTIADVRAASATGEVFVNGQHDATDRPRAIARSFVTVSPAPRTQTMDWQETFHAPITFTVNSTPPVNGGFNPFMTAPGYNAEFYTIASNGAGTGDFGLGVVNGELWVTYADEASDTTGKFRLSPTTTATMASGTFVHATMMTELWATNRRYPQLIISDQASPVQDNFAKGVSIVSQIRAEWPWNVEIELCNHVNWDTNAQCPHFHIEPDQVTAENWPPQPMASELGAPGQLKRFDVFVSRERAYVLLDGRPFGCANLSTATITLNGVATSAAAAPAAGPVTVTFGDVLYHSQVDEGVVRDQMSYPFLLNYQLTETRRIFDNLGFSSGQTAPAWNETLIPCSSVLEQ